MARIAEADLGARRERAGEDLVAARGARHRPCARPDHRYGGCSRLRPPPVAHPCPRIVSCRRHAR